MMLVDLFQQDGEKVMTGEHAKIRSGKFPIYHQFTAFTALTNQTVLRYMARRWNLSTDNCINYHVRFTKHIITRITN